MSKRLTNEDFINRCIKIHGDIFGFEKLNYINNHTKISLKCSKHGYFEVKSSNILIGRGCVECGKFQSQKANIKKHNEAKAKNNKYINKEGYYILKIKDKEVFIDSVDIGLIKKYLWSVSKNGYVITKVKNKTIYLHKLINNTKNQLDHINQNKLDNRKVNLRVCTHQQNQFNKPKQSNNTSGYKGVTCLSNNRFMAQIKKGDYKTSKNFNNIIDAAIWYNNKAKELFGEFAYLNEIDNHKE